MGKIKLILGASILLFVSYANADLMERDLFSSGDGLVTYDPSTGLEWLDLTETFGQRVSVVQQNIGLASLGFEIMSVSDVYTLFQSASSYRLLSESPSVVDYIFDDPVSARPY